jgi:hypothetical protein
MLPFVLNGCAIKPLPEDYAGVNTYEIVRRVRCEMRDAIRGYVIASVREKNPELADRLKDDHTYRTTDPKLFDTDTQAGLAAYSPTVIGYRFTFNILEKNNATVGAGFSDALTRGAVTLGISGTNQRWRGNERSFRVVDTFERLTMTIDNRYCNMTSRHADYAYPIAGGLRLDEMVGTFLDLNQSVNLGNVDPQQQGATLTDTIQFKTVIAGVFNPSVGVKPLGDNFEIVSAGVNIDAAREDTHSVTIVLTLPPDAALGGLSIAERRIEQEIDAAEDRQTSDVLQSLGVD